MTKKKITRETDFNNIIGYYLKKNVRSITWLGSKIGLSRATMSNKMKLPLKKWLLGEVEDAIQVLGLDFHATYAREIALQRKKIELALQRKKKKVSE